MSDVSQVKTRLTRRRWLTLAAAAGGALAAGAALSTPASASGLVAGSGATAGPATVKSPLAQMKASQVMNWFAQSSQGGYFAAVKNGYYTDAGIDMTIEQGGPQVAAIPLVAAGRHTFGMSSADQVLLAREEGIPVVMVYTAFQINPQGLMYHAANPVSDFPELNGRRVYVSGAGTFWKVLSAKYALDKVEQLAYTGQSAVFLSEPLSVSQCFVTSEPVILKSQGHEVGYLVNADSGFNPYQNAMVCLESTIQQQPDLVQAYVNASLKGWTEYITNPQPTLEFIKSDFNKEKDLAIEAQVFEAEKASFFTGKAGYDETQLGRMTDERWAELYSLMKEYRVIKKDIDYKAAFNTTFIENAHAAHGM